MTGESGSAAAQGSAPGLCEVRGNERRWILLTEFPWITLAAGSMWSRVGCADYGKYFDIVTFHFMNWTGTGTPGEHFPVGRFNLTLAGSPWHQLSIVSKPLSLSPWISEHPWQRPHFISSPGLLQVGSSPFGNSPHFWAAFD